MERAWRPGRGIGSTRAELCALRGRLSDLCTISSRCSTRVYLGGARLLTTQLKLVVDCDKSRVCRTDGVEFLGYVFHGYVGQIRVSEKNLRKFKQRAREITRRSGGISLQHRLFVLQRFARLD